MAEAITPLAGALLGLLFQQPRSGYDLRKLFAATPLRHFSDSPGAIYPALRRLRGAGLIAGKVDRSTRLRPRELFSVTGKGKVSLQSYLSALPTAVEVGDHTDLLFLRFVFIPEVLGVRKAIEFVEALERGVSAYLEELEAFRDTHGKHMSIGPRLSLLHGIETYALHRRWCRSALTSLRRQEKKAS